LNDQSEDALVFNNCAPIWTLYGPQKIVLRMRMSHTPKVDGVSLEACKANSSKDEF